MNDKIQDKDKPVLFLAAPLVGAFAAIAALAVAFDKINKIENIQ